MFDIREATIETIRSAFADGTLTSLELTMQYLERIAAYDQSGPKINSVLEINPDALDIAEALDREYRQKGPRSPLHGIPVLIKDNINTCDKMHTSAGSLALANNYAPYDAHIVTLLREAGAVILGKTNLTEFANFLTNGMRNGYSSRGGCVLNPYGDTLDVGGSSSGSGAAVSANFCTVAVGTETSGSILCPANWNGVVGLKPTKGLISRTGIIPICTAQDTAGPLTRTVADAAALLTVLAGSDPDDPATGAIEPYLKDYTAYLDKDGLKGMRIGVSHTGDARFPQEHRELLPPALQTLEAAGATLIEVEVPGVAREKTMDVLLYEFKQCLNAYLATCDDPGVRTMLDVIEFNNRDPERCLKYGQSIALDAQHKTTGRLVDPTYLRSRLAALRESRSLVDGLLQQHNLDCIVQLGWSNIPPSSGYPAINVPIGVGKETGHPIGLSFIAGAFCEPTLFRAAYAFEQVFRKRVAPPVG